MKHLDKKTAKVISMFISVISALISAFFIVFLGYYEWDTYIKCFPVVIVSIINLIINIWFEGEYSKLIIKLSIIAIVGWLGVPVLEFILGMLAFALAYKSG